MFQEEFEMMAKAAAGKINMLKKNPVGFFVLSMLAGVYVGFGIILIFSIGGMLAGEVYSKVIMVSLLYRQSTRICDTCSRISSN